MSDYSVDVEALASDARRWDEWADELEAITPPHPDPTVFGTVVGAQEVYKAFASGLDTLRSYIDSGHAEFAGIAEALRRSAALYATNDSELSVDARRMAYRTGLA
jgi:hypothetical protein